VTSRDTYYSSLATNHTNAEIGGISNLPGASAPGNAASWSRAVARAALANGTITQATFVERMQAIAGWEQAQGSLNKATLRAAGDVGPA
jgi:hypothetical protein